MEITVEKNLASILGISQAEANKIWNAVEKALIKSIAEDSELRLRGFGSFVTYDRPGGTVTVPGTADTYEYPAYKAVQFRASQALKDAVNGEDQVN
ncbi:MAG: HU family DNA-binding protein [Bacteroidota bacterium]